MLWANLMVLEFMKGVRMLYCDKCNKLMISKGFLKLTLSGYVVCESGKGIKGTGLKQNSYNICPDCIKLFSDFMGEGGRVIIERKV